MSEINMQVIFETAALVFSFFAVIYGLGVVWRVELKLDITFKYFLAGIVFFFMMALVEVLNHFFSSAILAAMPMVFEVVFSVLFLAAILTMRKIIRKMDGEKEEDKRKNGRGKINGRK